MEGGGGQILNAHYGVIHLLHKLQNSRHFSLVWVYFLSCCCGGCFFHTFIHFMWVLGKLSKISKIILGVQCLGSGCHVSMWGPPLTLKLPRCLVTPGSGPTRAVFCRPTPKTQPTQKPLNTFTYPSHATPKKP